MPHNFSKDELELYSRHILLNEIGLAGQKKLAQSRILIVGAGGLGSPLALYLAAAGVGHIRICDFDRVEQSNLGRQVLFRRSQLGKLKAESAAENLQQLNPAVMVEALPVALDSTNWPELVENCDLLIEGSDSFGTKFLLNDISVLKSIPAMIGGILQFDATLVCVEPGGFCYRCLFHSPPPAGSVPTCAEAGVVGALAGWVGSFMAFRAVQYLSGITPALNAFFEFNGRQGSQRNVPKKKNPACPVCSNGATITAVDAANYPAVQC